MKFLELLTLCIVLFISTVSLAMPLTTISTVPSLPNQNGWFNQDINIILTASDENSIIMATFYTLDLNKQRTPKPNILFSSPVILTQSINSIRYYSISVDGNEEKEIMADFNIDTTPPANALGFVDGIKGIIRTGLSYDLNYGIIMIPGNSGLLGFGDVPSGIDFCELNFDYNNLAPNDNWEAPISDANLSPYIIHYYPSIGEKFVAVKCTDKAGNETISYSTPVLKINVVNPYDFTPPVTSLKYKTNPNSNGWLNASVKIYFDANDNETGITQTLYCIGANCIPNIVWDKNEINLTSSQVINFYSINGQETKEQTKSSTVQIDSSAPNVQGYAVLNSTSNPLVTGFWDINFGTIRLMTFVSDESSGIDYCQYNFDYNALSPLNGWERNFSGNEISNFSFDYNSIGTKRIALLCVDKAGNKSAPSTAPFLVKVLDLFVINNMVINPTPVIMGNSVTVDLNIPNPQLQDQNNLIDVNIIFSSGSFTKSISAQLIGNFIYHATITPDNSWPKGDYNVIGILTAPDGSQRKINKTMSLQAAPQQPSTPSGGNTSSGSTTTTIITTIRDTNALIQDNNTTIDVNANAADVNIVKPILDNNAANTLDLNISDRNASAGTNNALAPSPATGFFGLFDANGVTGNWVIPVLILLLALFLVLLWIRKESFAQGKKVSKEEIKWPKK